MEEVRTLLQEIMSRDSQDIDYYQSQFEALILRVTDEVIGDLKDTQTGLDFFDEPNIYQNMLIEEQRIKRDTLLGK